MNVLSYNLNKKTVFDFVGFNCLGSSPAADEDVRWRQMDSPPSLWGLKEAEKCFVFRGVESFCRALLILSLPDAHGQFQLDKVCAVFVGDKCEEDAQVMKTKLCVCLV